MNELSNRQSWVPYFMAALFYFFSMFVFGGITGTILNEFNPNQDTLNSAILQFFIYLVITLGFIAILFVFLKNEFFKFKQKIAQYIVIAIGGWLGSLFLSMIINSILIMNNVKGSTENQISIETLMEAYPLLIIPAVVIFAPIVEEIFYRGIIFKSIKNLKLPNNINLILAFIVSSTIFGLIHVIPAYLDTKNLNELLLGIPYIATGFVLAFVYYITNNIYVSMILHFIQNSFSTIMILILIYLRNNFPEILPEDLMFGVINFFKVILHI